MAKTFIDIHVLQTVPPSNINRDDTGSPKSAYFGGVIRARVSSQAWKRATRQQFKDELDPSVLGVRTKRIVELVAKRITELQPQMEETAPKLAVEVLTAAGIKVEKPPVKKGGTKDSADELEQSGYLMFLSTSQISQLAELAIESASAGQPVDKKAAKPAANTNHSVDVSLFGRMVADSTELSVDAAAQVAHAISVHGAETEFDYFTAIDDLAPADNAGAGMIGTVEFNSSTLYRYATVNLTGLQKNLGTVEATAEATRAFVRSFLTSMPTGKQNTFANRTLPDCVLLTVRTDFPINLVGAFEEPVTHDTHQSRLANATEALISHYQAVASSYSPAAEVLTLSASKGTQSLSALAAPVNLDELATKAGGFARDYLGRQS